MSEWEMPRDPARLHALLARDFGIDVPTTPLIAGHASCFDYLVHAFFEEESWVRFPAGWRRVDGADDGAPSGEAEAAGTGIELAATTPRTRDCVVWANRGGGKTYLGAIATMLDLVFKPGIEVRILGGSLEQSKRMHAHLATLFRHDALAPLLDGRITQTRVRLRNGSACEVLAQSQTSVRGTRVQKLRCDEVELFDPEVWEAAQLTTRSKRCGEVSVRGAIECLSTMHIPHGIMFRIVKEASGGRRRLFKWGVVDVLGVCDDTHRCTDEHGEALCPLYEDCAGRAKARDAAGASPGHVPIDDAIDLRGRVALSTWQSEMLCLRPSRGDSVYPEFDHREHVVRELPTDRGGWTWVAGMDFGFRAPTVVLRAGVDREGVLWVVDEHVRSERVLDEHIDAIRSEERFPSPTWVGVDPAGRQRNDQTGMSNVQRLRRAGLVVRDRAMGIGAGILLVRARLAPATGGSRLRIHERCAHLIECMERYHYPRDNPESLTPEKDGSDHAADALRYMVQNLDCPLRSSKRSYL